MEQYKTHRKVLQTAFLKIGNELKQFLTAEETNFQDIHVHWYLFEDKHGSLQDIKNNEFDSLLKSDAPEELGAERDSCDGYMKKFTLLLYKYEQLWGTTRSTNEERDSIVSGPACNVSGTTGCGSVQLDSPIIIQIMVRQLTQPTTEDRLKNLKCFLKSEVENEEWISLAAVGFEESNIPSASDTLSVNGFDGTDLKDTAVTKKNPSMAHRVYDPMGFTSPAILYPKLLLLLLWEKQLRWDDPVDDE
ncbi:hypothetical protein JTB14_035025 [Gonioctena quinquepunctata]|nr:hypothetical protein JTB14_035025 [Gonioctena quinquepunctata]